MQNELIGDRIRKIRNKEPRRSFAERFSIGTATLQRYEDNDRLPDIEFLKKLHDETGHSLDFLVYGKETNMPSDEVLILEKYRQANSEIKNKMLMLLLSSVGDQDSGLKANQNFHGNVGQVIQNQNGNLSQEIGNFIKNKK